MDTLTKEELNALAAKQDGLCISVYVSLHRRYPHTRENQPKLGDFLDEAKQRLVDEGLSDAKIQRFLKPARDLIQQADFWEPTDARGLALFLASTGNDAPSIKTYRLPYSVTESLDVGGRLHVTPLVGLLDWNSRFHLLALSLNEVRLYACDHLNAEQIELPTGVPTSFEDYTAGTEVGRPIQFRSSTAASPGGDQVGIVHGQTSYKDEHKARVKEFVSQIGKEMHRWLDDRATPLVLAAVVSYHPVFHKACTHRALVPEGVHGSPDQLTKRELHAQAVQRVSLWQENRFADFNGHYTSRMAHGHASSVLELIVPAASAGRVESLLVAGETRVWGWYEATRPLALVHEQKSPGDVDLLDLAVAETLAHGGEVHATDSKNVPDGSPAAAVLRW